MDQKISIAYLIDTISSDKAGTEKQLLQILGRLDRDKFAPTLVCLHDSLFLREHLMPCVTVCLGYRGFLKLGFPLVIWRYLKILRSGRFQVVQTFFEDAIFVGFLGKAFSSNRHALVVSRRDLGLGADEPIYHRFFKKLQPWVLRSVAGISTNTKAIKDHVERHDGVPSEKIQVIANGLDLPVDPMENPALFSEYPDDLWIGIVANLKPVKRIDLFLRALANLGTDEVGRRVRGVIIGEGRLRLELVDLAEELGITDRVHFVGSTGKVYEYLHHFDIGVLCSDKEGLSNAVLEYMACGLPVVVTAVGGNCELVDETNGICVPAGDYVALSGALARLVACKSLRKELGEKSRQKVLSTSTWETVMPQWESYYCLLAGREGGASC
jgi:L-malate glycosyltransferase